MGLRVCVYMYEKGPGLFLSWEQEGLCTYTCTHAWEDTGRPEVP